MYDIFRLIVDNIPDKSKVTGTKPAEAACAGGFSDILSLILERFNIAAIAGPPLLAACKHGHTAIVEQLIKAGVPLIESAHSTSFGLMSCLLGDWSKQARGAAEVEEEEAEAEVLSEENKDAVLTRLMDAGAITALNERRLFGDRSGRFWRNLGGGGTLAFLQRVMHACGVGPGGVRLHRASLPARLLDAMESACEAGHTGIVQYLFEFLRDNKLVTRMDARLLRGAARGEQKGMFQMVLDLYSVDLGDLKGGYNPDELLLYAVSCSHEEAVATLLASGKCNLSCIQNANLSSDEYMLKSDERHGTALAAACDPAIVKMLLDAKADANPKGSVPVITSACMKLRPEAVRLLLAARADATQAPTSMVDKTPLIRLLVHAHRPSQVRDRLAVVELLLGAGAKTRFMGATAVFIWANWRRGPESLPVLRALLAHDPGSLEMRNVDRVTPLMTAILNSEAGTARGLLEAGANINQRSDRGEPLLFAVIGRYQFEQSDRATCAMMRLLLDAGADPLECGWGGQTLLMRLWKPIVEEYAEDFVYSDSLSSAVVTMVAESVLRGEGKAHKRQRM
jgi:ankyrin repeat protein